MSGVVALRCPECGARSYQEAARVALARTDEGEWVAVEKTSRLSTDRDLHLCCYFCGHLALGDYCPLAPLRGEPGSVDPVIEHCAACAAPVLVTGSDLGALCVDCKPAGASETEPLPEIPAQRYVAPFKGPTAVVEARMGSVHFRVRYPLQPELETQRECLWVEDTDHAVCGRPMRFVSAVSLWDRRNLTCPDCIAGRRVPWLPVGVRERARVALRCLECSEATTRDAARLGFGYGEEHADRLIACVRVTGKLLRCKRCRGLLTPANREQ